jgi:hypothetical protein
MVHIFYDKATEVDGGEEVERSRGVGREGNGLFGLEERVTKLEHRIKVLEDNEDFGRRKRRMRRKAK